MKTGIRPGLSRQKSAAPRPDDAQGDHEDRGELIGAAAVLY